MGNKTCYICVNCKMVTWLEDYEVSSYMKGHRAHIIIVVDDEAIGDSGKFEETVLEILK